MLKTKAIVISQKAINEHDCLLSFYTLEFGRTSFLARGLKKPNSKLAAHLDLLNLVDLMIIKGRERDYVGSAIAENCFLGIKKDYNKICVAGEAINFLNKLSFNNQTDYEVFLLLRSFLFFLNEGDFTAEYLRLSLNSFKLKLLNLFGYNFDFSTCFICQKRKASALNFFRKDLYCSHCLKNVSPDDYRHNFIKLSTEAVNLKSDLENLSWDDLASCQFTKRRQQELENLIDIIIKII